MKNNIRALELCTGVSVRSINQLHSAVNDMNHNEFSFHVNNNKNDFYTWTKNILKDKDLADDLIECSTIEAVKFCLASKMSSNNYSQAESSPMEHDRETDKFTELPRGYHPKFGAKDISGSENNSDIGNSVGKGALVTLINLNEIKKNTLSKTRRIKTSYDSRIIAEFESKKRNEDINNILLQLKEVFKIE